MTFDLPLDLLQKCRKTLGADILDVESVSGGDINQARFLTTTKGIFFLKTNNGKFALDMFETEAMGLELLRNTKAIRIPETLGFGQTEGCAFLLLEYIKIGYRQDGFWEQFGHALANLHQCTSGQFGLDHSNYIGSLPQPNGYHGTFPEFYIHERLQPQLVLAMLAKKLTPSDANKFEKLYQKLPGICPDEPPALIHGDLWSGNFIVSADSHPVLFDPSVAYSHREMDLAMSRLFGGFDRPFYRAYEETYPLAPGFEKRMHVYQLYYLLVHVNLFGGGYVGSVRRILEGFQ